MARRGTWLAGSALCCALVVALPSVASAQARIPFAAISVPADPGAAQVAAEVTYHARKVSGTETRVN